MKKTKLLLGFLLLLWGGIFSCKGDLENVETSSSTMGNNASLSNVRTSFESRLKTDPNLKNYKIEPRWDKAIVSNNIIEMPFTVGGKTSIPCGAEGLKNQGRARLVLTESGSNYTETIVYYIPSLQFKGKIADINIQNIYANHFSGKLISMRMGSNEWNVLELSNGSIVKNSRLRIITDTKNGKVKGCSTENVSIVWVTWDGHENVYNYTTIPVTVCDDSDGDTGNGNGGGNWGSNGENNGGADGVIDASFNDASQIGLSGIENLIGVEPTVRPDIVNKCQFDALREYVNFAANAEHDYDVAKNECLSTYMGGAASVGGISILSGQLSLSNFSSWWSSTGKFTTYRGGAANAFFGALSFGNLAARDCIERKLADTIFKIDNANREFKIKHGQCR